MMTIKQRISYAVMGLMAMGFTACTQNEDMAPTLKGQEINATFSVGGMQTRVNTLGYGDSWEDKDELKVSIFTDYDPGSTAVLSYNSATNEWSRSGSFRWLDEVDEHTILAVYPSDTDFGKYNLQYDLQTDQSSEDKLKNADLITGYWYDIPWSYYVDIPMKHRMSLVTIVYHVGTADYPNMDISEPQVYSKHYSVDFSRDQARGQFVMRTPSGNPAWVKAYKHDDGMFSAIVIPGSYKTGEIFVKFKIGDQNFHAKMRSDTEFQEGHRYTYELNVGKDKVELTRISVDDLKGWDSNNEEDLI
jgi:hypothetical protein